jgi:glucose/arabinose dehydrogenase
MPRSVRLALLTVALLAMPAAAGAAVTVPTGFDQRVLAAGISQPTQVAWAPDGRMFVAEKPGRIRVVTAAGALLTAPLMDITARVNSQQDRGLLGIALSPTFAVDHQLFYVFTYELQPGTPDSDAPMVARVERVTVNADNTVSAPTVVLGTDVSGPCPRVSDTCMPSDGRSHSIGTIRFGPDGTLWIGLGDSADYNVVDELAFRAQEEGVMSGKLLHVDTSGRGLPGHPFCPSETDLTKTCTRLYAKGFRNPYRFTITAGGVPLVGDVGWGSREELDRVVAGGNYGWPCWEGDRQTTGYSADARCTALYAAQTAKAPLHTYSHDNANAAIVGGPVMPADTPFGADYAGDVFFGDYAKGFVQRLDLAADGTCTTTPCTVRSFATGWVGTDLELSPARNLAWTLFGTGGPDGSVVEVLPTASGNRTPVARATVTPLAGSAGRGYRFGAGTSTDPDGDPLTATWDFGDGTAAQAGTDVEHVFAAGVTSATVTLTVADGRGATATDTVTVHPGDAPPVPQITAPAAGARYTDGQPFALHGGASDPEDGALTGAALTWHMTLHHGTHVHVLGDVTGTDPSFTPYDDHDADSHYEVTLTATDSAGNAVTTAPVRMDPRTIAMTLRSSPTGAVVGYGEGTHTTPDTFTTAVGYRTTLTAPATTTSGGNRYAFASWSDGGAAQHELVVGATDTTLTATYGLSGQENKALAGTASASSQQNASYPPDRANDGSTTTRWSSAFRDGEWWQVDLGSLRAVDTVTVNWEAAYATRYLVQTSTDGATWSTAADVTLTARATKTSTFASRDARYVRITALTRATIYGASFWEVSVFGGTDPGGTPPPPPPPPPPPSTTDLARTGAASASSVEKGTFVASYGNDGLATTRWSSSFANDQWWQVDLGAATQVGRVRIVWEAAYASAYDIQTSTDGTTFTTAASVTGTGAGARETTFTARSARWVRVLCRTRATPYGCSFWAAEVYSS